MPEVSINSEHWNHCGTCADSCPLSLFTQTTKHQVPEYHGDHLCHDCGHCAAICPKQAISHSAVLPERNIAKHPDNQPLYDQVIEMIRSRRSIRAFKGQPVDKADIEKIEHRSTKSVAIMQKNTSYKGHSTTLNAVFGALKRGIQSGRRKTSMAGGMNQY